MELEEIEIKRNGNGIIITQELIKYVCKQYTLGKSQLTIAKQLNCDDGTIRRILKKEGVHIRNDREQALKFKCNENYFSSIDTEDKAYWLGFLYADGYIRDKRKHSNYSWGLTLTESDKEHLVKLNNCIESDYDIKTYRHKKGSYNSKPYCKLLISSPKMAKDLIKYGVKVQKTEIIEFPYFLEEGLVRHFIRGYIDGDGCITYHFNKNNTITTKIGICGTKELLEGIKKYFKIEHLKLQQKRSIKERGVNNYSLEIGGNKQVLKILDHLYGDSTIYLDRKYEKYLEFKTIYNTCRA